MKKEFINARKQIMRRSTHTLAQNKVVTEWTLPKMIIKAREEEKLQKSKQAEYEKM